MIYSRLHGFSVRVAARVSRELFLPHGVTSLGIGDHGLGLCVGAPFSWSPQVQQRGKFHSHHYISIHKTNIDAHDASGYWVCVVTRL